MYLSNIALLSKNLEDIALKKAFNNPFELCREITKTSCASDMCKIANKYFNRDLHGHDAQWIIEDDTDASTTLTTENGCWTLYLIAYKVPSEEIMLPEIDNMSDEKLIMELIKRGYSVNKTNSKKCTEQNITFKEVYDNLKAAHPDWNNARLYMTTKSQFRK